MNESFNSGPRVLREILLEVLDAAALAFPRESILLPLSCDDGDFASSAFVMLCQRRHNRAHMLGILLSAGVEPDVFPNAARPCPLKFHDARSMIWQPCIESSCPSYGLTDGATKAAATLRTRQGSVGTADPQR